MLERRGFNFDFLAVNRMEVAIPWLNRDHFCFSKTILEHRMVCNHVRLKGLQFLLLFEQSHHHADTNVDHIIGNGKQPEVSRDDRINKVDFDVAAVGSTTWTLRQYSR